MKEIVCSLFGIGVICYCLMLIKDRGLPFLKWMSVIICVALLCTFKLPINIQELKLGISGVEDSFKFESLKNDVENLKELIPKLYSLYRDERFKQKDNNRVAVGCVAGNIKSEAPLYFVLRLTEVPHMGTVSVWRGIENTFEPISRADILQERNLVAFKLPFANSGLNYPADNTMVSMSSDKIVFHITYLAEASNTNTIGEATFRREANILAINQGVKLMEPY